MKILNEIINRTRLAVNVRPTLYLSLAYCTCFLAAPVMSAEGWRVITEDLRFPTDDVIVAFCSVTDPQYKLPADPAKSDCTPAIQRALDDASAAGGGTVFLPEGKYRLEGMLTIASNVILRGRWSLISPDRPAGGTILMIHNKEHEQSVLIKGSGCGVRDLTFWHPEQKLTESVAAASKSPLVIRGQAGVVTIENINLINPYRGIDLSQASTCCLRGIYGSPLFCGLSADRSYAVSRYDSIHFSPDYWTWSKLPGSPPKGGAHAAFMRSNGTGVHIYEMDGFYFGFSRISGYQKGLHFERGASGDDASGELSYISVTDCDTALHVDDAKGFRIVGSTLKGSKYGIWGKDRTHYKMHTTNIEGGERSVSIRNGVAELVNCTVNGKTEIVGHRTVYRAHQYDQKLPPFQNSYDRVRKPAKADLFNVKSFGAVGNRKADDTQALKKAIKAASANGGGIVFVPDGEYRITEALNLGKGVELRGNSGGRHILSNKRHAQLGSVLFIETGEGEENGTPFLTLGDGSGLRGMGFYYPKQDYKKFKKYPYMVRANGTKTYVIDCSASNPYQGLELNGDDHLVDYSFIGGLRRTYRANDCSGGRIQNCHIKPDFWRDAWLPGCPKTAELEEFKFRVNEAFEPIYLNGCDDYVVMSIFNHASHTLMTVDDSSGQALMVGGEQLQQGYAFKNGAKTFEIISSLCNINHIGGRGGTYGMKTYPGFKGEARFYCSLAMGTSDRTWDAQGGHLFFQQTSITGPSNRGANSIHCGPDAVLTARSGGCPSHHLGYENQGKMSFKDFHFEKGFLRSAAGKLQPANHIKKHYILADANQPSPTGYGLVLDMSNLRMEEALIVPNSGLAKDSLDGRRLPAARLKKGDHYSLDVTDPGYQNGLIQEVEITLYFRIETTCTIKTFYQRKEGMKLGNTVNFEVKDKPFWKEHRFKVTDATFGSDEDLRIKVEGPSPLLGMVVVSSPTTKKLRQKTLN
tara:strand:+ start:264 stop:3188 length:2925 start_codon:yes stop_codon:yes gene_type:complete